MRVASDAMVLVVSFHTRVLKGAQGRALPTPAIVAERPRRPAPRPVQVSVPVPLAIAGGAALVSVAAYLAFGATKSLLR